MPHPNNFRHQRYSTNRPQAAYRVVREVTSLAPDDAAFAPRMSELAQRLRSAGVRTLLLTHGTFAGPDSLGLLESLSLVLGRLNDKIKNVAKSVIDAVAKDAGNFTRKYAADLQQALNAGVAADSPEHLNVVQFLWSSENNHIGRADGAIRLLGKVAELQTKRPGRVLLLGHSHGGNVFALFSNLVNSSPEAVAKFLDAAAPYYRIPATKIVDSPHWKHGVELLTGEDARSQELRTRLQQAPLDFVTLGTPIRYGWDLGAVWRLLNIVNHKTCPELPDYLAQFPRNAKELAAGDCGDLVHLLGIAGTNMLPAFFSPRGILADQRLNRVLQAGIRRGDVARNIRCGMRVAEEGQTLLVNFGRQNGNVVQDLAGHAVYTRAIWMTLQLELICNAFYPQAS